jgi:hypothetical protein
VVKKIKTRIAALEAELKDPPRRICKVCGREGGGGLIWEHHHDDGVVSYDPRPPCPGCDALRPPGEVRSIVICPHGCWCENDPEKVAAALKVSIAEADEVEFEKYASGAAKYHRRLREGGEED